ncbi:MAG: cobalamin-binding protein [Deltaproteobacteria bacterium]|nr:cobalamin-binding protein [Deltaproteobacteria bacterium]
MHRIVTLLPSATEIICALGFEAQLVGRSHECDYPPAVVRLPALTSPKFNAEGSSAEVDQSVKKILADALSVYRVNVELLQSLKPDVIVTQSQCEVCAVSIRDVEQAAADWIDGPPPMIISLAPYSLGDVMADIQRVGVELGEPQHAMKLVAALNHRMTTIEQQVAKAGRRPAVGCIEWLEPLMAAGNWMPELVTMAGGENIFGEAGQHSSTMKFERLLANDPDVIMLMPCGFSMDRTAAELETLTSQPGWPRLKAVRELQVYLTDGNQYFNRPGPRITESLEILAEILHPEIFHFEHEGTGWRRLSPAS